MSACRLDGALQDRAPCRPHGRKIQRAPCEPFLRPRASREAAMPTTPLRPSAVRLDRDGGHAGLAVRAASAPAQGAVLANEPDQPAGELRRRLHPVSLAPARVVRARWAVQSRSCARWQPANSAFASGHGIRDLEPSAANSILLALDTRARPSCRQGLSGCGHGS